MTEQLDEGIPDTLVSTAPDAWLPVSMCRADLVATTMVEWWESVPQSRRTSDYCRFGRCTRAFGLEQLDEGCGDTLVSTSAAPFKRWANRIAAATVMGRRF
jgi:hypothetical protein